MWRLAIQGSATIFCKGFVHDAGEALAGSGRNRFGCGLAKAGCGDKV